MKFSDTTNKSGLIQYCEMLLGMDDATISGNETLLKQFTMLINRNYYRVVTKIWEADSRWEFDDKNYSTHPIADCNLVDSQQDYELPDSCLKIVEVHIKKSNGDYKKLTPIDKNQFPIAREEFRETDGEPQYYDLVGGSMFLYPAPSEDNVTLTEGLRLYLARELDEFTASDTTQQPGFDENFHHVIAIGASYDYSLGNDMSQRNALRQELEIEYESLKRSYNKKNLDTPLRVIPRRESLM